MASDTVDLNCTIHRMVGTIKRQIYQCKKASSAYLRSEAFLPAICVNTIPANIREKGSKKNECLDFIRHMGKEGERKRLHDARQPVLIPYMGKEDDRNPILYLCAIIYFIL